MTHVNRKSGMMVARMYGTTVDDEEGTSQLQHPTLKRKYFLGAVCRHPLSRRRRQSHICHLRENLLMGDFNF